MVKYSKERVENNRLLWEQRSQAWRQALKAYENQYGSGMIDDFWAYWSEPNRTFSKMRWEMEDVFLLERRLQYWEKRAQAIANADDRRARNEAARKLMEERKYEEEADRAADRRGSGRKDRGNQTPRGGSRRWRDVATEDTDL